MSRRTYNERRAYSARVMRFRQAVYTDREPVQLIDLKRSTDVTRVPVRFGMTNGCRLLLLRLTDDMDAEGRVSIPRSDLASHLGVATARITEWVHVAHRMGFLQTVRRGRPGVTAVYQGLVPGPDEVRHGVPSQRYARADQAEVRPGVPVSGREGAILVRPAPLPREQRAAGSGEVRESRPPQRGSNEHQGCQWRGSAPCPSGCTDHPINRQEGA